MKVKIIDAVKGNIGEVELPTQFSEEFRPALIARAVLAVQSSKIQAYGADPRAGKKYSAKLSRRRRDFKTPYGRGVSRIPRKTMSRSGTQFNWQGALAPGTVGGRQAHPPKANRVWTKAINKKERRKAIRSALSATMVSDIVKKRGHKIPDNYPFITSSEFEGVDKTKSVMDSLKKLGFDKELARISKRTIRAGKGKARGRRYKSKTGPLIVVSKSDCKLMKSAKNLMGIDVVAVNKLNAEILAPGTLSGRFTLFTAASIEKLSKDKLFA
jgi:large subunit ribosomal protein L4e